MVQRNVIGDGIERSEVGLVGEAIKHGCGRGVQLVHRWNAKYELDSSQQAGLVVLGVNDGVSFGIGTGDIGGSAVAADVVPTILRVVFDGEDAGIGPEFGVADGFENFSERDVVVGNLSFGRGRAEF